MRRFALTLLLLACVFPARSARATTDGQGAARALRLARASFVVPVEWDGIWANVDSTYTCDGTLQDVGASTDTICGGKEYLPDTAGSQITFTCSGSATPTTFDMTCTAAGEIFTDCVANYTIATHGTRSGDTDHLVTTIEVTYTGTAEGCDLIPTSCTQFDSWGTRIGPAPASYCSIPTLRSTWGSLKTRYR
jgi:hypothetical protein